MPDYLDQLNAPQQKAVTAPTDTHMLVLAGAGSGKTRVLVHRIAWLISHHHVPYQSILAVTFTNKAAKEMQHRVQTMLHQSVPGIWLGTFHGIAHRMLRLHSAAAQLPEHFNILDGDDQLRLIKRIMKAMHLEEPKWSASKVQSFINKQKEQQYRAKDVRPEQDLVMQTYAELYQQYERQCQDQGLVDFTELLLRCTELLTHHADIRSHYHGVFSHILVDEFQDTNKIQYTWLRLLTGKNSAILAVGDDDQSIYSWRGAEVEHMHLFTKDFHPVDTIKLEQNYRSTQTILNAANAVIRHNHTRLGKTLWTDADPGSLINIECCHNGLDEARYLVYQIKHWARHGFPYSAMAILYRSNAQSRVLEEYFTRANVPYRIYGGFKFFDRAEIKDALSYLRLTLNHHDDVAFERVMNTPPRGIGHATLEILRHTAKKHRWTLWESAYYCLEQLPTRGARALQGFLSLIEHLSAELNNRPLDQYMQYILKSSTLIAYLQQDKTEQGRSRLENLEELVGALHQFVMEQDPAEDKKSIAARFLANVALDAGDANESPEQQDSVQFMTLHASKGLEFPIVFLTGMEEGLFPHIMATLFGDHNAQESIQRLEEERRLCYVGMTRAMQKLYLTHVKNRRLYGRDLMQKPSRFLGEIPTQFIDGGIPHKPAYDPNEQHSFSVGNRVSHPKFGKGTVIQHEGRSQYARLQIRFDDSGVKWLMPQFANLSLEQ